MQETEAWLQALFELIPVLDKETLKSEVMSMALSKGDVEENPNSRVICARILGAIAPFLVRACSTSAGGESSANNSRTRGTSSSSRGGCGRG